MSYIVWNEAWGPVARVDGDVKSARLREDEIAIPCEPDADVNDRERWAAEAEAWKDRVPTLDEVKADKLAALAEARWRAEVGGTELAGIVIRTDRESQAMITGAALQATIDPSYTCRWKTGGGFVELDAQMILGVAMAVRAWVQGCFDREAELAAAVAAAETVEEVQAVSWEL